VGSPTQIAFSQQPSGASSLGAAWTIQPAVSIEDAGGNVVTSAAATITLSDSVNTGTFSCAGGLSKTTTNGTATFSGCKYSISATGETLTASASGYTSVTSASFDDASAGASKLAFLTQPAVSSNGNLSTFQVELENSSGVLVTSATGTVSMSINSGPLGATIKCPSATVSYGVATFTGCGVSNSSATAYTLKATDGALSTPTVTSNSFTVSTISSPAINYPTATNQINPGPDGTGTYAVIGTGFVNGAAVSISAAGTVNSYSFVNSNIIIINVTGTGGIGAQGNVSVTNPDGGNVIANNAFLNG